MSNWRSASLSEVCQIKPPKKEAKAKLNDTDLVSFVPMNNLGICNKKIDLNENRQLGKVSGSYTYFADDDVLLAKITPCFENGKLGIASDLTNSIGFGSSEFIVFRSKGELVPEYLFYFLSQDSFRIAGAKVMTGAVGHKRVPKDFIENHKIPLPPLPEQKCIVAILNEVFAGISKAVANAEKNLANARELFESQLCAVFDQARPQPNWMVQDSKSRSSEKIDNQPIDGFLDNVSSTKTRGRAATDRVIAGDLSLSVGFPPIQPRTGWNWSKLMDIARLESGHTPSRRHPEYWDGTIPWIGIKDAKINQGRTIKETLQHTNQLGLDNSAARLLPKGTVCLSRTASVGYVVVMGQKMATSQDFVNWVCFPKLDPHFLKYLLLAEGDGFFKYSTGAVHQTIYFPEVKAFHICHPGIKLQRGIVKYLDHARSQTERLQGLYEKKLIALAELKQSILQKAFTGELTANVVNQQLVN